VLDSNKAGPHRIGKIENPELFPENRGAAACRPEGWIFGSCSSGQEKGGGRSDRAAIWNLVAKGVYIYPFRSFLARDKSIPAGIFLSLGAVDQFPPEVHYLQLQVSDKSKLGKEGVVELVSVGGEDIRYLEVIV
jgi:hypothetical protein